MGGSLMPVDLGQLLADLEDETKVVDELLAEGGVEIWSLPTPADGWSVTDQVSHLAYFDDAASLAATDPDRFRCEATALMALGPSFTEQVAARYRSLSPADLLKWFREARARYIEIFASLDAGMRLPWYGPPMSAASSATARLMETWAHGKDIADTVGADHPPSRRLRHIAHLGVSTFAFSFEAHGLDVPTTPVRVELSAPGGVVWVWGDPDADETVTGAALDFCLLVTQRCHPRDTALVAVGPAARQWLSVAQAFAGPPGTGRSPSLNRSGAEAVPGDSEAAPDERSRSVQHTEVP
jgi:uncharacterized protein (TIGR03084 family)